MTGRSAKPVALTRAELGRDESFDDCPKMRAGEWVDGEFSRHDSVILRPRPGCHAVRTVRTEKSVDWRA